MNWKRINTCVHGREIALAASIIAEVKLSFIEAVDEVAEVQAVDVVAEVEAVVEAENDPNSKEVDGIKYINVQCLTEERCILQKSKWKF